MVSEDGSTQTKEMNLQDLRFERGLALSVSDFESDINQNTLVAYPNPMSEVTSLNFNATVKENLTLSIYDQLGKVVYRQQVNASVGKNKVSIQRQNLSSGLYICKLESVNSNYKSLKLLIR